MSVRQTTLIITITTCFLISCGGGGGSEPQVVAAPTSAQSPTVQEELPHSMPDSNIGFKSEPDVSVLHAASELGLAHCTLSVIEWVFALDLNDDSQKDLLMFVLCGSNDVDWPGDNVEHEQAFRNNMIALVSQPNGDYIVDNQTIFGSDYLQLGGEFGGVASFFTPLENPTGGLPLISYVVSRDDFSRKYKSDLSNLVSQQGILVPSQEGQYEPVSLGNPVFAQGVLGIPNSEFEWDLLFGYWNMLGTTVPLAFRQAGNDWLPVEDEYAADPIKNNLAQAPYLQAINTNSHTPFLTTKPINVDYSVAGAPEGIRLYQFSAGSVLEVDFWNVYENVEWIRWGEGEEQWCGRREIMVFNDKPYFGGFAWDHFEIWYPSPDSEPLLLAMAAVQTLADGGDYDPEIIYTCDTEFTGGTFMALFDFNAGTLSMLDSPFETDTTPGGGQMKQTLDINGDGYMDWFTSGGSAHDIHPKIWLNDQNGGLNLTSTESLPTISDYRVCDPNDICLDLDASSFIVDMNEDGVVDLVQWHKGTVVPVLHDWMYEAEVDASAFENKSGYVHIWYGSQN